MRELKHIHYYERLLEERAFEGGYNFLDAYFSSDTCQQMNRVVENIHELKLIDNPRYTHEIIDAPLKISPHGVKFYCEQVRSHFMKALADLGCDVSDEAIRRAVEEHNRMCAVFEEICKLRKAENPVITPREFHILCVLGQTGSDGSHHILPSGSPLLRQHLCKTYFSAQTFANYLHLSCDKVTKLYIRSSLPAFWDIRIYVCRNVLQTSCSLHPQGALQLGEHSADLPA